MEIANMEAIAQALDAMSFILVAPEFLREETLASIRTSLNRAVKKLALNFFSESNDPGVAGVALIVIGTIGFSCFLVINRLTNEVVSASYFFMFLCTFQAAIGISIVLLQLIKKVLFRRFFFIIGAMVFFATRAMLFWTHLAASDPHHAAPPAAPAPHRSSAEPSPQTPPGNPRASVISNWQTGDILIGRLHCFVA
jgi:hypothetical protein